MLILGIDTTSSLCSIALAKDETILAAWEEETPQRHAQILLPHILNVLKQASLDFKALDLLAVTTGPGSFTGIRTGIATMQGFQLALNLPLLGINAFELYAAQLPAEATLHRETLVLLKNQKSLCYAGLLNHSHEFIKPPAVLAEGDIAHYITGSQILLTGSVASALQNHLPSQSYTFFPPPLTPRAAMLCLLAYKHASKMRELAQPLPKVCKPFYIAPPSTTTKTQCTI